ncbi:MAG TPA: hypothetical protein VJK51_02930 [Candidatus Nanoarchaeia archaeon]|nr:hypothetical protein [Candidatus Nanoarchaeia archaeon]
MLQRTTTYTLDDFYIAEHFEKPKHNRRPNLPGVLIQDVSCYPMNAYTRTTISDVSINKTYSSTREMLEDIATNHPLKLRHSTLHLLRVFYSAVEQSQTNGTIVPQNLTLSREEFIQLGCPLSLDLKISLQNITNK